MPCHIEKYTKTCENQNVNGSLLEILAWINFHWGKLIPNNKKLSLIPKIVYVIYYSGSFLWLCKNSGGSDKSEVWNLWSLIVPLMATGQVKCNQNANVHCGDAYAVMFILRVG